MLFKWQWGKGIPFNESVITRYSNSSKFRRLPSRRKIWPPATIDVTTDHRTQLIEEVNDWRSYVEALEKCDFWWSWTNRHSNLPFSVLGETHSYLHTICGGREIARSPEWRNLTQRECYILRGEDRGEDNWALLGSCRGKAVSVFNPKNENITDIIEIRERIHSYVDKVRDKSGGKIARIAHGVVQEIVSDKKGPFQGFGPSAATRLLTLARPDCLVSVNGASEKGLWKLMLARKLAKLSSLITTIIF